MTCYVANHEKKNRIFAKREQELRHAIKHNLPADKILLAAEKVRAAKIAVFKCRFTKHSTNQPQSFRPEEIAAHDEELRRWLSMSGDEIVSTYLPGVPKAL